MTLRDDQRRETYARIVDAAVESLVENGYAATTAAGVQKRLGVTRGALLHHFPTSEQLIGAAVQTLVERNLDAVRRELKAAPEDGDPVRRGVLVLYRASRQDTFAAELELWAAARADQRLRRELLPAERVALKDLQDAIDDLFGPTVVATPGYRTMVGLTVQFLRGLTISGTVGDSGPDESMVENWAAVMRASLEAPPWLTANTSGSDPNDHRG